MDNPVVSVFVPGIRTDKWLRFYKSLKSNRVSFEIIFIGDKRPKFDLPDRVRFVYSEVKPTQCAHIGFLHAKGEYLVPSGDDCVYSKRSLDLMLKTLRRTGEKNTFVTPRYQTFRPYKKRSRKKEQLADFAVIRPKKGKPPLLPVGGMVSRKLWNKLGGMDRRFICSDWEQDMAMKLWEIGGSVVKCKKCMITEVKEIPYPSILPNEYKDYDRRLLYSLWCVNSSKPKHRYTPENLMPMPTHDNPYEYKIVKTRSVPLEPYDESNDIYTITQGPKGIWK